MTAVIDQARGLGIFEPRLFELGDHGYSSLPLELFAEIRDERPCFWQPLDEEPAFIDGVWVVSRHADVVAIVGDTARFASQAGISVRRFDPTLPERGGRPTMVALDGARHQRNRTVTAREFSPRAIQALTAQVRQIAVDIVSRAVPRGRIDFVHDVAAYMPLNAITDIIGVPEEDRAAMLAWANTIITPADPVFTPSEAEFLGALNNYWDYGLDLCKRRQREPANDVMTLIAAAHADGRLDDEEVRGYMLQLAVAGIETTRNAMAIGLHALLLRPDQMALIRSNPEVSMTAVDEILRWSSPTMHIVRKATEDVTLHGQTIRAGETVALILAAANFDPRTFDDPTRFDLTRTPNEHLTFGYAAHTCLGISLARLEIKLLLEEFFRQVGTIELDGEVTFVRDCLIHGIRALPIRVSPSRG